MGNLLLIAILLSSPLSLMSEQPIEIESPQGFWPPDLVPHPHPPPEEPKDDMA